MRRLVAFSLLVYWGSGCRQLTAEIRSLTILHTNDIHARLTPLDNRQGGFAYLAAVIRRERANCIDCLLLNAGDMVRRIECMADQDCIAARGHQAWLESDDVSANSAPFAASVSAHRCSLPARNW